MEPFERFDDEARRALAGAHAEAERARAQQIGTEHLLLALLDGDGGAGRLLGRLGVDAGAMRQALRDGLAPPSLTVFGQITPGPLLRRAVQLAFQAAHLEDSAAVTSEHLLLGVVAEGHGPAARVLDDMGVTAERVREQRAS